MMTIRTICNSLQTLLSWKCLQALFALLIAVASSFGSVQAADGVEFASVQLFPGRTQQVAVRLNNAVSYTAFQLDIYLPKGVTLDTSVHPKGMLLSNRADSNHTLTTSTQPDGSIRVVCYSSQNTAFTGQSGNLLLLQLAVPEDAKESCTIELKNIIFTTTAIKEVKFQDVSTTLEVNEGGYIIGDTNEDGEIDLTDASLIFRFYSEFFEDADAMAESGLTFVMEAADVNGDGSVDLTDASLVFRYYSEFFEDVEAMMEAGLTILIPSK